MKDFIRGVNSALGVVAGFLPIAMSFGAIAVQSGLSTPTTVGMSLWLYAGASQFALVEGVRQGLPGLSILLTVLIINLRHIPMSLSAQQLYRRFQDGQDDSPDFSGESTREPDDSGQSSPQGIGFRGWRLWALAHGLIDETFALEASRSDEPFLFYLGMHLSCWLAWSTGTLLGSQFGQILPERWLQFALPGLFLCLLMESLRGQWQREIWIVLGVGVALTLVTQPLGSTGILLAIVAIALMTTFLKQRNNKQ